jgi:hypothetical protein
MRASRKAERQRRANRQRAEVGKHFGTRRPFGFELDGVTVRPDEAVAVRDAFAGLLSGQVARRDRTGLELTRLQDAPGRQPLDSLQWCAGR